MISAAELSLQFTRKHETNHYLKQKKMYSVKLIQFHMDVFISWLVLVDFTLIECQKLNVFGWFAMKIDRIHFWRTEVSLKIEIQTLNIILNYFISNKPSKWNKNKTPKLNLKLIFIEPNSFDFQCHRKVRCIQTPRLEWIVRQTMTGSCASRWYVRLREQQRQTFILVGTVAVWAHCIRAEPNKFTNRMVRYNRIRPAAIQYHRHRHHRRGHNQWTRWTMATLDWANAGIQPVILMHSQRWLGGKHFPWNSFIEHDKRAIIISQ